MYNLWWIVIACAILFTICLTVAICIYKKHEHEYSVPTITNIIYYASIIIDFLCGVAFVILLGVSIGAPISAQVQYNEFIETQAMVEVIYTSYTFDGFENAGLNNKIIEVNSWLTHARANKKQFGDWSKYFALDLDSLDYIKLVKGEKNG